MGPWLAETRKQGPDAAWPSQVLGVCGDLAVTASYRTSGPSFFFPFLLGHVLLGGCLHMSVPGLCGERTFQPEAEVICGPQGSRGPLSLCLGLPCKCGPKEYDSESNRDALLKRMSFMIPLVHFICVCVFIVTLV